MNVVINYLDVMKSIQDKIQKGIAKPKEMKRFERLSQWYSNHCRKFEEIDKTKEEK